MKLMKLVSAGALIFMAITTSASAGIVQFSDGFTQDRGFLCAQTQKSTVKSIDGTMTMQVRVNGTKLHIWRDGRKTTVKKACPVARPMVQADTYQGDKLIRGAAQHTDRAPVRLEMNARRVVQPDLAVPLGDGCYMMGVARGMTWQGKLVGSWVKCPVLNGQGDQIGWKNYLTEKEVGRNEWAILTNTAVGQIGGLAIAAANYNAATQSSGSGGATAAAQVVVDVDVNNSTSTGGSPKAGNGMD